MKNDYRALPVQEYEERKATELALALQQHGENEALITCAPAHDIMDDAIWLLVRLSRLADGIEARARLLKPREDEAQFCSDMVRDARALYAAAARSAFDLIRVRQQLLRRGYTIGEPILELKTDYAALPIRATASDKPRRRRR